MPEPTLSQRELLRRLVLEAFNAFAVHDHNLPSWWGRSETERFVDKLTDRIAALSSPIREGVRDEVIEECAVVAEREEGLAVPAYWRGRRDAAKAVRKLKSRSLTPGHMGEARG